MSRNQRIIDISNMVFDSNQQLLIKKSVKDKEKQKEEFESQLEKLIADLKDDERKNVLDDLYFETEKGNLNFFDNNGDINFQKVKSKITEKVEGIKFVSDITSDEESEYKAEAEEKDKNQDDTLEKLLSNIEIDKETEEVVQSFFKEFDDLSEEKQNQFLDKAFGIDAKAEPDKAENVRMQTRLTSFRDGLLKQGLSLEEIQRKIDENPDFAKLDPKQRKMTHSGKFVIELQVAHKVKKLKKTNGKKYIKGKTMARFGTKPYTETQSFSETGETETISDESFLDYGNTWAALSKITGINEINAEFLNDYFVSNGKYNFVQDGVIEGSGVESSTVTIMTQSETEESHSQIDDDEFVSKFSSKFQNMDVQSYTASYDSPVNFEKKLEYIDRENLKHNTFKVSDIKEKASHARLGMIRKQQGKVVGMSKDNTRQADDVSYSVVE